MKQNWLDIYIKENYPLLQIKISKIYVKDFLKNNYNFDPTLIRCYLYNENNEFNYEELEKIGEYYITKDICHRNSNLIIKKKRS